MATIDDTATMNLKAPAPRWLAERIRSAAEAAVREARQSLKAICSYFKENGPHCQFCVSSNILSFSVALRQETRISVLSYT
jgi:hypothetical protein